MKNLLIQYDDLHRLLHYNPETGHFTWKVRQSIRIMPGCRAGSGNGEGYRKISLMNLKEYEHRLAWLYMTGEFPELQIDHINRNRCDNRWSNLRLAESSQNARNRTANSNSKSGVKGVCLAKDGKRWRAYINVSGRQKNIGYFQTLKEAQSAHNAVEKELFPDFHSGFPSEKVA